MEDQIFIVTRQQFYVSRGRRHVLDVDCPVVGAWSSKQGVDNFFERRIPDFIAKGFTCEHVVVASSLGTIERYIIKDENGDVDCRYSVIIEPLI